MNMIQHFPIMAIMAYFLGAFLIVIFGGNRLVRNLVGFLATATPLCLLVSLVKPVMLAGQPIAYWMGNRVPAGGSAALDLAGFHGQGDHPFRAVHKHSLMAAS